MGDACGMKERYEGIDGLKACAIIGIALMHILENGNFGLNGFVFQKLIPSFTNLVFLFMSFTPKDTAKSGRTSHCFVRWIL